MTQYRRIFNQYLKTKGARLTPGRGLILDAVFANHGHFDVEELYEQLKRAGGKVSRATLYRTLPLLVECGLVRPAMRTGETTRYEHIWGHPRHMHIVCRLCGRVIEEELGELGKTLQELGRKHRYHVEEITVNVRGVCAHCRGKEWNDVRP